MNLSSWVNVCRGDREALFPNVTFVFHKPQIRSAQESKYRVVQK